MAGCYLLELHFTLNFLAADNVNAEAAREITDGLDTFEAHARAETAKYATLD